MYRYCKRLLDILLAAFSGLVLLPALLVLALIIKLDSPGPVLFVQTRSGRGKQLFKIYKFRTMQHGAPHEIPTHLLDDPTRWITRIGRFLRRSSIDELPQLWNILRGDMSFVGPRPALWNQYDLIAARDEFAGRFGLTPNDVRPGLTGWAQINGRDELPVLDKVRFDNEYVALFGLRMDCRCFFGTFARVVEQAGVVEGDAGGKAGSAPNDAGGKAGPIK